MVVKSQQNIIDLVTRLGGSSRQVELRETKIFSVAVEAVNTKATKVPKAASEPFAVSDRAPSSTRLAVVASSQSAKDEKSATSKPVLEPVKSTPEPAPPVPAARNTNQEDKAVKRPEPKPDATTSPIMSLLQLRPQKLLVPTPAPKPVPAPAPPPEPVKSTKKGKKNKKKKGGGNSTAATESSSCDEGAPVVVPTKESREDSCAIYEHVPELPKGPAASRGDWTLDLATTPAAKNDDETDHQVPLVTSVSENLPVLEQLLAEASMGEEEEESSAKPDNNDEEEHFSSAFINKPETPDLRGSKQSNH